MLSMLRSIFHQSTFYKDAQNLISMSNRFKPSLYNDEHPKLDPFSTNEIWLNWLKACEDETDINEHLSVGIQIIGIQQKFDRSIKKSYKQLSNYVQNNVDCLSAQQLNKYLELVNTTYLNEQDILTKIYDKLAKEKQHNFKQLVMCANLQCHDMELVSSLIDQLHNSIESQELGQYLYALLVLIPNEQSSILINLVDSKLKDLEYIEPTIQLKQVALVLKQLYAYKNRDIPKALHNLCTSKISITMRGQPSLIQKEIQILLNMVKINYIQEYQVQDLYQVDFYLGDEKKILEINGPHHYVYDIETKNPVILKGRDFFKSMVLQSLGYKVQNLCYKDFYNAKGVTKKLQLLKELI